MRTIWHRNQETWKFCLLFSQFFAILIFIYLPSFFVRKIDNLWCLQFYRSLIKHQNIQSLRNRNRRRTFQDQCFWNNQKLDFISAFSRTLQEKSVKESGISTRVVTLHSFSQSVFMLLIINQLMWIWRMQDCMAIEAILEVLAAPLANALPCQRGGLILFDSLPRILFFSFTILGVFFFKLQWVSESFIYCFSWAGCF